jgi:hydrogenase nickel incorporation protein HypA/HybF
LTPVHEYSVASSLLDLVEGHVRAHGASRVLRVHVRIGEQSGVEPELLRSAWQLVSERGPAAAAALELHAVPVRWECRSCEKTLVPTVALRCSACGRPAVLAAGSELFLDRIELEVDGHV